VHARGGCGFRRHGTYQRVDPPGTRVARWYCPQAHGTFSLLPDHLAARFPGSLHEIEEVVATLEQARSVEAAADRLRGPEITLPSAVRWVRRRLAAVRRLLTTVIGLLPQRVLGCTPTIAALRERLGCPSVLVALRAIAGRHLQALAAPLGFRHPSHARGERKARWQQYMGPDPPGARR
jgi:hypothetical protein